MKLQIQCQLNINGQWPAKMYLCPSKSWLWSMIVSGWKLCWWDTGWNKTGRKCDMLYFVGARSGVVAKHCMEDLTIRKMSWKVWIYTTQAPLTPCKNSYLYFGVSSRVLKGWTLALESQKLFFILLHYLCIEKQASSQLGTWVSYK